MLNVISEKDRNDYIKFATDFYNSKAVAHKISSERIEETFETFLEGNPYADCYMLSDNGVNIGYLMTAKTYSQEAGGMVLWIEEIYVAPEYRGKGHGQTAIMCIEGQAYHEGYARVRLEYSAENPEAGRLYARLNLKPMPYLQMVKDFK